MELALLVYLIATISNIKVASGIIMVIAGITTFISVIAWSNEYHQKSIDTAKLWAKRSLIVFSIFTTIVVLTPTEKTSYTMIGAYAAQKVSEDPRVQQLSGKVLKVIENKLDEYIAVPDKVIAK